MAGSYSLLCVRGSQDKSPASSCDRQLIALIILALVERYFGSKDGQKQVLMGIFSAVIRARNFSVTLWAEKAIRPTNTRIKKGATLSPQTKTFTTLCHAVVSKCNDLFGKSRRNAPLRSTLVMIFTSVSEIKQYRRKLAIALRHSPFRGYIALFETD